MDYTWQLYESRKEHFNSEFFDKISKKLNTMQDGQDVPDSMSKLKYDYSDKLFFFIVTKPNPQTFVFVRFFIKKQCHQIFGYIDL